MSALASSFSKKKKLLSHTGNVGVIIGSHEVISSQPSKSQSDAASGGGFKFSFASERNDSSDSSDDEILKSEADSMASIIASKLSLNADKKAAVDFDFDVDREIKEAEEYVKRSVEEGIRIGLEGLEGKEEGEVKEEEEEIVKSSSVVTVGESDVVKSLSSEIKTGGLKTETIEPSSPPPLTEPPAPNNDEKTASKNLKTKKRRDRRKRNKRIQQKKAEETSSQPIQPPKKPLAPPPGYQDYINLSHKLNTPLPLQPSMSIQKTKGVGAIVNRKGMERRRERKEEIGGEVIMEGGGGGSFSFGFDVIF